MNIFLINEYMKRITKNDIIAFAKKEGINLTNHELEIIYQHIKKDYKTILYGNHNELLDLIKTEVSSHTYSKIELLYQKYKEKLK